MILLTERYQTSRALLIIGFQFFSIALFAVFLNYFTVLASFSWWVPTAAHFTFNQINPRLLGSVYTNKKGMFVGELHLINGEGFMGCVVGIIFAVAIFTHKQLYFDV